MGRFFRPRLPPFRQENTSLLCQAFFSKFASSSQRAFRASARLSVWLGRTEPREGGAGDEPDDGTVERRCCVLYRRLCVMQFMSSIPDPINKAAHIDAAPEISKFALPRVLSHVSSFRRGSGESRRDDKAIAMPDCQPHRRCSSVTGIWPLCDPVCSSAAAHWMRWSASKCGSTTRTARTS